MTTTFSPLIFAPILGITIVGGAVAIGFQFLLLKLEKKLKKKFGETPQKRIERLTRSLREASELTSQIEREIAKRHSVVEKLRGDVERYEELAKLKGSEVEAVAQTLRGELKKEGNKAFWLSIAVNLVFFVMGAALTTLLPKL
ncbi:hypothetical protein [Glaciimonas sp. PCH181]|uniref:hypothetical protein n=1 Tax=Glaciimonas sp. PCH181 TaxID=2133943 RepID=UPI000D3682C6|nr:hypothetical protein [Glaciimonas sp. PCH181]PUA17199.1 hypothetical protein C7W93_14765 [Glaciimonas sp. PCH181]